jgi:hypothetical protein
MHVPINVKSTNNISKWQMGFNSALLRIIVPTVLKSGSLNLLETSGPVQACNVIALSLPLYMDTSP